MATTYKAVKLRDGTVRYRVRFRLSPGTNPVSETFDTAEEAQRFCDLVDAAGGVAARNARQAAGQSLGGSLNTAFDTYMVSLEGHATRGVIGKNRRIWDRHVAPHFGAWPIEAITRENVEQWVAALRHTETVPSQRARARAKKARETLPPKDYLSPKTIRNIHGLLSAVLGNEVIAERITHNRAYKVALPQKQAKRDPVFLTESDYAALLAAVPEEWQPLVNLMAGTGARWGEATALRPEDFDFDSAVPTVRIRRAWKSPIAGGEWEVGPPKTVQGNRTVSLSEPVARQMREAVEGVPKGELVFTGPRGGRLRNQWFHERVWLPATAAAGLTHRPVIHDLRHSHASWLIASGIALAVVQQRLGHASINVTVDVYGHIGPDSWRAAAAATEAAMTMAMPEVLGADLPALEG